MNEIDEKNQAPVQQECLKEMIQNGHARRMGSVEDLYVALNRQNLYRNFCTYGELSDYCTRDQLTLALREICLKNPTLLHIVLPTRWPNHENYYRSSEYYSRPHPVHDYISVLQELKLSGVVLNEQPEYSAVMKQILEEFKNSKGSYTAKIFKLTTTLTIPYFGPTGPSWRLICLPEEHTEKWKKFVFVSNHCMSDGRSSIHFFHDLRDELNNIKTPPKKLDYIFKYEEDYQLLRKLPEPIEKVIDFRPPYLFIPKSLLSGFIYNHLRFSSKGVCMRMDDVEKTDDVVTEIINISPTEFQAIKANIKSNIQGKCTITPFLHVCWFVSLHKWGKFFKPLNFEWLTDIFIPADCRSQLPDDDEMRQMCRYGANVGFIDFTPWISEFDMNDNKENFWPLIEHYHEVISEALRNKKHLHGLGFNIQGFVQKYVNIDKVMCDRAIGKRRGGTLLSNVGLFNQLEEPDAKYSICDLAFGQFQGSWHQAFSLGVCSTNVKGMNIVVASTKNVVGSQESLEELCFIYKALLLGP
uniref:Alcohol acetyltransferase n=1 Tax=Saccharomyces cerevisiae TaxID=4932 RepID=A0A5J6SFV1_YEASX|nr:alcohol acetyltransferase [Saccharomyces cerevisiae]